MNMRTRPLNRKEAEALRAALRQAEETDTLLPDGMPFAIKSLAPQMSNAAQRLQERNGERRSLRLQAWGLAGCSSVFLGLVCLAFQYRDFLLASPTRWGPLAGLCFLVLMAVGCLPILMNQKEREC
jgi:hypothetical protein